MAKTDVEVSVRLSPKQAGALYMKCLRLQEEVKSAALAHEIALEDCAATLESECLCAPGRYWNTSRVDEAGRAGVERAVRYLEARGLLERHPEHADLVRVKEQADAQ